MHVYCARLPVEVEAPHQVEQLLAAEHQPLIFDQGQQQVEFFGAQVYQPPGHAHLAPRRVNRQGAGAQGRFSFAGAARLGPAQNRLDARDQFARVEGLGQVVVRA